MICTRLNVPVSSTHCWAYRMKVAAIQLRSGVDIAANIDAASVLIREAANQGATFIVTPEMTTLLQRSPKRLFATITDEAHSLGMARFSALAKELGIDLLIGSMAIKTDDRRAANRGFLFGPDGTIKARYDKIHMFDVSVSRKETWKESNVYDKGKRAVISHAGDAKLGLSICYDVRFPHLYRQYGQAGADIITVPAAFTRPTGEAHWEPLLRARAIETGAFIIAAAQGGEHEDGRATWGHSIIVNPWGEIVATLNHDAPGILVADIDLAEVVEARRKIPAWQYDAEFSL